MDSANPNTIGIRRSGDLSRIADRMDRVAADLAGEFTSAIGELDHLAAFEEDDIAHTLRDRLLGSLATLREAVTDAAQTARLDK